VASAEPNRILRAFAVPNDPLYARQAPHYGLINLPSAWDLTTGSPSVVVAVVDTGVRPHPDLAARLLPGYDFVPLATGGDGDGPDADANDPGQDSGGGRLSFHGTHVAGTVGAIGNNGLGVSGVAWRTSLLPVRVLGTDGSGTLMAIIQGIRYAARLPNDSGLLPGQRADVMNLSLGGSGSCSPAMQQAISEARAQGTIIVAAAGNNGRDEPTSPAGCAGVVSVASVDLLRQRAPYSNFGAGPSVDVAAPGGDMRVDRNGDGSPDGIFSTHSVRDAGIYYADYTMLQGTSMAAPHVAGVAALLKAVAPALTPDQFSNLLQSGALTDDIGPVGADSLGVGLINAAKAVRAVATGLPTIPAQLAVSPRAVSFGAALTTLDLVVSNAGDGSLAVGSITPAASWVSVSPLSIDGNGLGTYRVTVDRGPLNPGVYAGEIVFSAGSGTPVRVAVLVEKSTTATVSDGGFQYALLVRTDTLAVVDQVNLRARGGSTPFSFNNVPHGTYGLVIGSDLDNDGYICDAGDACGAWPVLARPEPIVVTGPRSGFEVVSSYAGAISAQTTATGLKSIEGSRRGVARR
jgi:serine protease